MTRKRISILGSTGSIGTNALDVVAQHPEQFSVVALAAGRNIGLLADQAAQFRPQLVSVELESDVAELREALQKRGCDHIEIACGADGAVAVAVCPDSDLLVSAFVGAAGLLPTLKAIEAKKDVALANKEVLVVAGELVMRKVKEHGVALLPVDSEHSAIFQCLQGNDSRAIRRILLTASGGPFLHRPIESFASITLDEALAHPNWKMGPKITIDSATMMNKGLEFIEAKWLFDQPAEKIEVHIHPESVVHSMVEFWDGSVMAQLGVPDMRSPIAYALSYPERLPLSVAPLDLFAKRALTFFEPERARFPGLYLAIEAARLGGSAPAVLNAANEVANAAFRDGRCAFLDIVSVVESVLTQMTVESVTELPQILEIDAWARARASDIIAKRN